MNLLKWSLMVWLGSLLVFPMVAEVPTVEVSQRTPIQTWLLCGPFPNPLAPGVEEYLHDNTTLGYELDYLLPLGGESQVTPQEDQTFTGLDGKTYGWRRYTSPREITDLCSVFTDNQKVLAYVVCVLNAEQEQDILLSLGSNDGIKAWLNGELIWNNPCARGVEPDQDYVPVKVHTGSNQLLLKIVQGGGKWGFYARITDYQEAEARIHAEVSPEAKLETKLLDNKLTVVLGRTSRLCILKPIPTYSAHLLDDQSKEVAGSQTQLGETIEFNLEPFKDGPYQLSCVLPLPHSSDLKQQASFYKGTSGLRVNTGGNRVEYLNAEFQPVETALKPQGANLAVVQPPDSKPFYLRMLLDFPGLGKRWFLADKGGQGFSVTASAQQEIQLLDEVYKTLQRQVRETYLHDLPAWLKADIRDRLSAARYLTDSPADRLKACALLSTLKASLPSNTELQVWYAPGTEKVAKDEATPTIKHDFIPIDLAQNEYEPIQIVLRSNKDLANISVCLDPFVSEQGVSFPPESLTVNAVGYVEIKDLSDYFGELGLWPDPLPALVNQNIVKAGENTPLWLTVYAPPSQAAGTYRGNLIITAQDIEQARVPLEIKVYGFALPKETHTRTAYGVGVEYGMHGPLSTEEREQVFDLYMQCCASHRISPYSPHAGANVEIRLEGEPIQPVLDFTRFDKAMTRYLDGFHFNSFNLGNIPEKLGEHLHYSPEYNRIFSEIYQAVQEHLREKNWLDKAYWYWVDEPPKRQYPDVKQGMELLKQACPDIRRLLTCNQDLAPVPYFNDVVNLWVPIMDRYDPTLAHPRQALGEEVWWYVCTGPRAPYPNDFIDHPAINHRIRYWMMDALGLDGDLYWSVTYWAQNPWQQAMSVNPEGGFWGNGDGRLLYPPRSEAPTTPLLEGPVTSIRFENLRDGLEDREYLLLLRATAKTDPEAANLLKIAHQNLVPSMVCYQQNPILLSAYRTEIACVLE
jgi:hypothetical protein